MEFEYLETERLRLRFLTPDVYRYVFRTYTDDELLLFFGLTERADLERERAKAEGGLTTYRSTICYFHLIDKTTGRTIGSCGFHNWFAEHRRAEIGYMINDALLRGSGLMAEALRTILRYGFEQLNLHRVEALIGGDNEPSLKLARRFGFQQEGILRQHWNVDGDLQDSWVFGLLKPEWERFQQSDARIQIKRNHQGNERLGSDI